jgi:hypothetical protein
MNRDEVLRLLKRGRTSVLATCHKSADLEWSRAFDTAIAWLEDEKNKVTGYHPTDDRLGPWPKRGWLLEDAGGE